MASSIVIDGKLLVFAALARKMNLHGYRIDRCSLSNIFHGTRDPSFKTFKGMAEVMGLSLDQMNNLIERVRAGQYYRVGV